MSSHFIVRDSKRLQHRWTLELHVYCLFNIGYVTQSRRTHNKRTKLCCLGTHEEDFYITAEYAISQAHKVHVRRNDIRFCSCISDAFVNLEFQNYAWLKKEYATLDAAMRNHQPLKRHLGARLFLRFEPSINKIDIRVHNVPHAYEFNGESVTEPTNTGVHYFISTQMSGTDLNR